MQELKQEGFNLRIPPTLKPKCKESAKNKHISLNQWIVEAMEEKLLKESKATDSIKAEVAKILGRSI